MIALCVTAEPTRAVIVSLSSVTIVMADAVLSEIFLNSDSEDEEFLGFTQDDLHAKHSVELNPDDIELTEAQIRD